MSELQEFLAFVFISSDFFKHLTIKYCDKILLVKNILKVQNVSHKQCMVYLFSCDLCGTDYVARHLHQCIVEHKNSVIGKHLLESHGSSFHLTETSFESYTNAALSLNASCMKCFLSKNTIHANTQTDSIRAKHFI